MDGRLYNDRNKSRKKRGFSMIEMIIVIGILGIMIGVGATSFVTQANRNRLNTTSRIISTTLQQARQMAIAMRQDRRVAIDAGELDGFSNNDISGVRIEPARIWIEGKRCEQLPFSANAACQGGGTDLPNAIELTDTENLPDGVMIGFDDEVPGIDGPNIFYVEFSPRGNVSKVYYEDEEQETLPNFHEAVIFVIRDNESFQLRSGTVDYHTLVNNGRSLPEFEFNQGDDRSNTNEEVIREDLERYDINTVEIIRLTGRTRTYDYAVLGPFPLDHPPESTDFDPDLRQ